MFTSWYIFSLLPHHKYPFFFYSNYQEYNWLFSWWKVSISYSKFLSFMWEGMEAKSFIAVTSTHCPVHKWRSVNIAWIIEWMNEYKMVSAITAYSQNTGGAYQTPFWKDRGKPWCQYFKPNIYLPHKIMSCISSIS